MSGVIKKYHVSKNLFDKTATDTTNGYIQNGYLNYQADVITNSSYSISEYIDISGNTNITISGMKLESAGNSTGIGLYDANKTLIASTQYNYGTGTSKSFDVPNNAVYIRISYSKTRIDTTMLNAGSTALPYEPYGNTWVDSSYRRYETATDVVTSLPVTVYGDGETDISLLLKGNTETSGTPSPQNPVTIQGVGNETANLFSGWTFGKSLDATTGAETINGNGAVSDYISVDFNTNPTYMIKPIYIGFNSFIAAYNSSNQFLGRTVATGRSSATLNSTSFTSGTPQGTGDIAYIRITCYKTGSQTGDIHDIETIKTMAYVGTDDIPYEPYGKYKISILKDLSPLTPMYLSQQLLKVGDYSDDVNSSGTVNYKIGKYVITGQEDVLAYDSANGVYRLANSETGISRLSGTSGFSTHFVRVSSTSDLTNGTFSFSSSYVYLCKSDVTTARAFKTYLQQQYEAGTPVIIYYVLATETTESVTAPTITTTGGTATIDVDTTVKPSELDLTYHGWHEHEPLKRENGQWE